MIKIRLASDSKLHEFVTKDTAFDWIKKIKYNGLFSVLSYEGSSLDSMDRYYFDGERFVKEDIQS